MSNVAAPFRVRHDTQAKACGYEKKQKAVPEQHELTLLTAGGKLLTLYLAVFECASSACASFDQAQDIGLLKGALEACKIPLTNIPTEVIERTILGLPAYCKKHKLLFGIAHTLNASHLEQLPALD